VLTDALSDQRCSISNRSLGIRSELRCLVFAEVPCSILDPWLDRQSGSLSIVFAEVPCSILDPWLGTQSGSLSIVFGGGPGKWEVGVVLEDGRHLEDGCCVQKERRMR